MYSDYNTTIFKMEITPLYKVISSSNSIVTLEKNNGHARLHGIDRHYLFFDNLVQ